MITNKDIRVENGFLIINGDKYPLDGQSPEAIMKIVEDNSDTTPTENSTAPITSGGVFTALGAKVTNIFGGNITASSITEALGKAWDALTVYDKPVLVSFGWQGVNMAMMYKYSDSHYGMAMMMRYISTDIYTLSVNNDVKTYATK